MSSTAFKIIYEKSDLFGGKKEKEIYAGKKEAFKLIEKCHRHHYRIICIQHI